MTGGSRSLRGRYNDFIEKHEVAWELTVAAIAVAWVALGFAYENEEAPAIWVDRALTIVLAAEFVTRLAAAYDRRAYLRGHWIDAIALIPIGLFRGLRVLRLLRLLRLVRTFAGVYRALVSIERFVTDKQLVWLFMSWLGVAVICSMALYVTEVDSNKKIDDVGDALWWGVVTLTTVGYGDVAPETDEGKLAAAGLMILGISLFATITANHHQPPDHAEANGYRCSPADT